MIGYFHITISTFYEVLPFSGGHRGHNRVVGKFTTTYAISAYHHVSREFECFHTTLCDDVWQLLVTGWWFSPDTIVCSTNKTDSHDITEILLKVALNTIPPPIFASKDLHVSVSFDKTLHWCNAGPSTFSPSMHVAF